MVMRNIVKEIFIKTVDCYDWLSSTMFMHHGACVFIVNLLDVLIGFLKCIFLKSRKIIQQDDKCET